MKTVWVLHWKHDDGSGEGLIRAYESELEAKADLNLFNDHANVQYLLTAVPLLKAREQEGDFAIPVVGDFMNRKFNTENPPVYGARVMKVVTGDDLKPGDPVAYAPEVAPPPEMAMCYQCHKVVAIQAGLCADCFPF